MMEKAKNFPHRTSRFAKLTKKIYELQIMTYSGYFREIIKEKQTGNFWVLENVYAPKTNVPKHFHPKAGFTFVIQGGYEETFSRKTIEFNPFNLMFRPGGEVHSDHYGTKDVQIFIIEFTDEWVKNISDYGLKLDEPHLLEGNSLTWLMNKIRSESRHSDDFTPLAIEGLMLELVAEIGRKNVRILDTTQPRWLKQAKEILHENFTENISLSQIAQNVGVHPVYLAEMFRRHFQCTVGEYVRHLRIEFASRQISETDAPLVEIALVAGFANQSHFSRTFKHLTGFTPAEFRSISRRKS